MNEGFGCVLTVCWVPRQFTAVYGVVRSLQQASGFPFCLVRPHHTPTLRISLQYEREAAARGGGAFAAPAQRVSDFLAGRAPRGALPPSSYRCVVVVGGRLGDAWQERHASCRQHCESHAQSLHLCVPLLCSLGTKPSPLHDFYPPHMTAAFVAALTRFERQLPGFAGWVLGTGGVRSVR